MAGTVDGGKAAAKTNIEKYGKDFYRRIGAIGGRKGRTGGFFANRELARTAGAKGGRISRRTKSDQVGKKLDRVHQTNGQASSLPGKRSMTEDHSSNVGGGFGFSGAKA
jgi:hypothetical protein